jgi:hypothetical protein
VVIFSNVQLPLAFQEQLVNQELPGYCALACVELLQC